MYVYVCVCVYVCMFAWVCGFEREQVNNIANGVNKFYDTHERRPWGDPPIIYKTNLIFI